MVVRFLPLLRPVVVRITTGIPYPVPPIRPFVAVTIVRCSTLPTRAIRSFALLAVLAMISPSCVARGVMPTLLVIQHTTSPALHAMYDAVISGATDDRIEGVEVVARAALAATASDVLAADGYVLGTPANLGYMSGALKHFFDQIYYPCLDATVGRPYGLYVHGDDDTTGALRSIQTATTGLKWELAQPPLEVIGPPSK